MIDFLILALASALVLVTAARIAVRMYPTRPWSRVLAVGVLAVGEIVVLSQVLGALRLFEPLPMLVTVLGGAVATSLVLRATEDETSAPASSVRWPVGQVMTFVLAAFALGTLAVTLGRPSTGLDTLQYHWPLVAHWVDVGNLTTPKLIGIGHYGWYYPSNLNLVEAWPVLFTGRDLLLPWVNWVWFGFALAATAGLVRRLGGRVTTGVLAGLGVCTVPVVLQSQLRSGQVDLGAAALFAAAAFFLVAFFQDRHSRIDAAMGGVALGLAAGSKLVALPYAAMIGGLFAVCLLVAWRRGRLTARRAWIGLGYAAGLTALTGAFFYVRNLAQTGNPFFPSPVAGLPGAWFPLDVDKIEFTVADYLVRLNLHPWIVGPWLIVMWFAGLLAIAALVAVPLLLVRERHRTRDAAIDDALPLVPLTDRWVGCWLLPVLAAAVYLVTPTSAGGPWGFPGLFNPNMRYAIPFVLFAFSGLAATADRQFPRATLWVFGGVTALDVLHVGLLFVGLLPLGGGELPATTLISGFVLGTVAAGVAFGLAWAVRRFGLERLDARQRRRSVPVLVSALGVVAALAGLVAASYFAYTNRFDFVGDDYGVAYDFVREAEGENPDGVRIAYAAFVRTFPLLGSRLQNDVFLAAPRAPGKGVVARPFRNEAEFLDFMCTSAPDYLVARETSPIDSYEDMDLGLTDDEIAEIKDAVNYDTLLPHEVDWADTNPAVFTEVARDDETAVFRVDVDAACASGL
ncbi:MAG: hypothetical protein IT198_06465 [Acidimicrobiia bacterium]|nr:hypothetical protein [Acidimicrobiia bacterium]